MHYLSVTTISQKPAAAPRPLADWVCRSADMQSLRKLVEQVAATDAFVLVTGESGVGKDVVARAIHTLSPRAQQPLHHVWCAQSADALDLDVFEPPRGLLAPRAAPRTHGATVYFDDVADLSLSGQAKLIRVIESQEEPDNRGASIRILATTKHDLAARVRQGAFREELFYRLNVMTIQVPPLRKRREDVAELITVLTRRHRAAATGPAREAMSPTLLARMLEHPWPGNVRELENMVRRFLVAGELEVLRALDEAQHTSAAARNGGAAATAAPAPTAATPTLEPLNLAGGLRDVTRRAALQVEAQVLQQVLNQVHWNRVNAARALKISYKTLLAKIKQHGLT